ncbi:hypothetical protein ACFFUB_02345 [Algimonas porphyrae]|uniref:Uncharacterized protein n=1 Tax=Algimonas porphyrae TaxID=1128113 RepID=A0ABQ5UYM3_9PROT|nr:hypothetical protein [Algimonas porphyrae]GLQ20403.1 hypothetical protein GCM10007854_13580 [Algimonas porphyrae]
MTDKTDFQGCSCGGATEHVVHSGPDGEAALLRCASGGMFVRSVHDATPDEKERHFDAEDDYLIPREKTEAARKARGLALRTYAGPIG